MHIFSVQLDPAVCSHHGHRAHEFLHAVRLGGEGVSIVYCDVLVKRICYKMWVILLLAVDESAAYVNH